MRNIAALALGLLVMGLGLYGAVVAVPLAVPAAFDARGATQSAPALVVMLAITEIFTMFAGWVTARMVSDHRLGHALMMSTVGLAIAVCIGATRWASAPMWYYVISWILIPVAASIGAFAWARTLRRLGTRDHARRVATT